MTDPFLHALVLQLRAAGPGSLTPHLGHQAQALFLGLVDQVDPEVAARLHADKQGARSYTVAPLRLPRVQQERLPFRAGDRLSLRVALLRGELFAPFMQAVFGLGVQPALQLGQMHFVLDGVCGTPDRDPWAGYSDWPTLLAAARPATYLELEFATPTAVSQGEDTHGRPRVEVLPLPTTIFLSIARRWNDLAPEPVELDAVRAAAETTLVADYRTHTTTVQMANKTTKGFMGRVGYELRGDAEQRRLLALLADASFFLGVGMKTARGMGLCRRI